jgi:hypothetical protein
LSNTHSPVSDSLTSAHRMTVNGRAPDLPVQGTDVCAIVVTYHPDAAFPIRLNNVSPQVGTIVIVDNGSSDAERNMLREAASDRIALHEPMKTRKIVAVIHGWWDGIRGNMGPRRRQRGASAADPAGMTSFVSDRKAPSEHIRGIR